MSNRVHHEERAFAATLTSPAALAALLEASPLQLAYTFTPTPNPIRASTPGAPPNAVTIQVMISNPRTRPVTIQGITIVIPSGENTARALSPVRDLPAPVHDPSDQWSVTSSGDTITIEPLEGSSGELTSTIVFTIERIVINQTPGKVPITITEMPRSAPKIVDPTTYSLTKLPSDFPVTDFYADPPVLGDLSTPTTLYWACTEEGKRYSYSIASTAWLPKDCLNGGDCYSWEDGVAGVKTPDLDTTTTFVLSVIGTDSGGGRVVRATLYTTVRMEVPSISQNSSCKPVIRSGRLLEMHWKAYNAVRCSILLNGRVIAADVPADTYKNGYWLTLDVEPGSYQPSLVAHGASGAQATLLFQNITILPSAAIALSGNAASLAIAPGGKRAFVTSFVGSWPWGGGPSYFRPDVTVIDLTGMKPEKTIETTGIIPGLIAVTADGRYAVTTPNFIVSAFMAGNLQAAAVIDTSTMTASLHSFGDESPGAIASAGRGSLLLISTLSTQGACTLTLFDTSTRAALFSLPPVDQYIAATAVTADGKTGLALGLTGRTYDIPRDGAVIFVDIEQRRRAEAIPIDASSLGMAITPDGAFALVVGVGEKLTVVDIRNRRVEPGTIHIGNSGLDPDLCRIRCMARSLIAISNDGKLAYVLREGGNRLVIVDIRARRVCGELAVPAAVSVAAEGEMVLVTGEMVVTRL